jgi:hypothetical protein
MSMRYATVLASSALLMIVNPDYLTDELSPLLRQFVVTCHVVHRLMKNRSTIVDDLVIQWILQRLF